MLRNAPFVSQNCKWTLLPPSRITCFAAKSNPICKNVIMLYILREKLIPLLYNEMNIGRAHIFESGSSCRNCGHQSLLSWGSRLPMEVSDRIANQLTTGDTRTGWSATWVMGWGKNSLLPSELVLIHEWFCVAILCTLILVACVWHDSAVRCNIQCHHHHDTTYSCSILSL